MNIVALSGSPTLRSRSTGLLRHALSRLPLPADRPVKITEIPIRQLPPAALLHAVFDDPAIAEARAQVAAADFVIIATPIYKAAYSGLLKAFLDLLPQDGLRGKSVLPLATGGSPAHVLAIDYALKPVLASMGARHLLDGVFGHDSQVQPDGGEGWRIDPALTERLDRSLAEGAAGSLGLLGQPAPGATPGTATQPAPVTEAVPA